MRFPFIGVMLLVLCAPAHADAYSVKIPYWRNMPLSHVEKAFPQVSLDDLSCRVDTYRLEQLAVNLNRRGYEAISQREQRFFSGIYRISTWQNGKTGTRADVLHRYDGAVCVWEVFLPLGTTASAVIEPKSPP